MNNLSLERVVETLRMNVSDKKFVDVGKGASMRLGVSQDRLRVALAVLKDEGYEVIMILAAQQRISEGRLKTAVKVLAAPGTRYMEVADNKHSIAQIENITDGSKK